MIRRTFDASEVDPLLNHPDVRPTIGGEGPVTFTTLLEDRRHICLVADGGGSIFVWRGPGVYEGHSFFTARGREAIELGRQMLSAMSEDADLIWGATPESLRHVRWFNRKIGMTSHGMIETPDAGLCELFEKRF